MFQHKLACAITFGTFVCVCKYGKRVMWRKMCAHFRGGQHVLLLATLLACQNYVYIPSEDTEGRKWKCMRVCACVCVCTHMYEHVIMYSGQSLMIWLQEPPAPVLNVIPQLEVLRMFLRKQGLPWPPDRVMLPLFHFWEFSLSVAWRNTERQYSDLLWKIG